ncbi:hypothetical protein EDD18DRAFT_1113871 [Armillaria luteobubalina]|uniref:Uncharacterized protein n=1 Tax=Armillaria luteobubalina TaxID=153913 RepID=A0AA39P939_9AGAR|nr:hypothetical protein EDD18DRAFT_1113871 [Armillaria luteobubalina]
MCSRLQLNFVILQTADPFLVNVLLEAERRYRVILVHNGVKKFSIFCRWHQSWMNPQYHYTLQGYNAVGWMSFIVEMDVGNWGREFSYGQPEWNDWKGWLLVQLLLLRPFTPSCPVLRPALNHPAVKMA